MAASMNDSGLWLPGASTKEEKIEKWWEVNRKHDPPLSRGATPLVERCMRVIGWNEAFAKRVLKGYRQFMELKAVMNDWQETKLSPPVAILQMWEQHMLDNLNYTDDCFLLFGRVIGHDPDASLNERATVDRVKTTKIAFQARYGGDLDPDVWNYGKQDTEPMHPQMVEDVAPPSSPRGRLPLAGVSVASPSIRTASPADEQTRSASPRQSMSPRSPKTPTGNDPITIFLRDQTSGEETYFSLRYRSTLRIVFTVFAERKGLSQENLKFSFQGQTLTGYETPYSLGLEDRARIDVQILRR